MINPADSSAQRIGYTELLADANCGRILDLAMSGDRTGPLSGRIVVDAVFGTLTHEHTAASFQVSE